MLFDNPINDIMKIFAIPAEVNFAFLDAMEESCLLHKSLT